MMTPKTHPSRKKLHLIILAAAFASHWIPTAPSWSFTVSPMNLVLDCERMGAGAAFELKNPTDENVVVDIKMGRRTMDSSGKEGIQQDTTIAQNFVIYPPRLSLAAKEKRIVRLAVKGGCDPTVETPYRILFQQLPIQDAAASKTKSAAKVNLLLKYLAAFYLKPKGARPDLKVAELKAGTPLRGKDTLTLRIQNTGNAHQVVKKFKLLAFNPSDAEPVSVLTERELPVLAGTNFLPGVERVFAAAWPAQLPRTATRAVLKAEME